jgi:hypothetical protein
VELLQPLAGAERHWSGGSAVEQGGHRAAEQAGGGARASVAAVAARVEGREGYGSYL